MLERLQRIAFLLRPLRWLLLLIAAGALVLAGVSLMDSDWSQGDTTIPALLVFSWAITLYSFAGLFAFHPPLPESGAPWRARMSFQIRRGALWCLALVMLAMSLALVVLTWQLMRTWFVS